MKERKIAYWTISVLSTLLLLLCILTLSVLKKKQTVITEIHTQVEQKTEIVTHLVYVESESTTTEDTTSTTVYYLAKAYQSKIGIFDQNGTLIQVLDVYTKTLPQADRDLLEEGIELYSQKELNSLIEDYTG